LVPASGTNRIKTMSKSLYLAGAMAGPASASSSPSTTNGVRAGQRRGSSSQSKRSGSSSRWYSPSNTSFAIRPREVSSSVTATSRDALCRTHGVTRVQCRVYPRLPPKKKREKKKLRPRGGTSKSTIRTAAPGEGVGAAGMVSMLWARCRDQQRWHRRKAAMVGIYCAT